MKQYTPEQVVKLFRSLKQNEKGQYSFHDMQRVILRDRDRRVKRLCLLPCDRNNEKLMIKLKRLMREKESGKGPKKKLWRAKPPKPVEKISDQDVYRINALMLNRNTFRITEVNNGNLPSLTTNVKLLLKNRDTARSTASRTAKQWDSTCCVRKSGQGTYVRVGHKTAEVTGPYAPEF